MDINKIGDAERLFQLLSVYRRMKEMLERRSMYPVRVRLDQLIPTMSYIGTDDEEALMMFEQVVDQRISEIETEIGEL